MAQQEFQENDETQLTITVVNRQDGSVVDLSPVGTSVNLLYKINKGTTQTRSTTIYDAVNGIVKYQWGHGELSPAGKLQYQVRVIRPGSSPLSGIIFDAVIKPNLDNTN